MKKVSRKSITIIAVVLITCAVVGLAAFILLHDDKPVYTPGTVTHEVSLSDRENYKTIEFKMGPDVTGKSYDISVYRTESEESAGNTFISIDDGKKQKVVDDEGSSGYLINVISMIDNNGKPIIVVNMDYMSDDYFFVVYTVENGRLVKCDTEYDAIVTQLDPDRTINASYTIYFFGTWHAERFLKLTSSNRLQLEEGDYQLLESESRKLTALADVKAEIADEEGNYKSYTIKKGSVISLYATDGKSYVLFADADGNRGRIKATYKDGFTFIGEKYDTDLFAGVMYAG